MGGSKRGKRYFNNRGRKIQCQTRMKPGTWGQQITAARKKRGRPRNEPTIHSEGIVQTRSERTKRGQQLQRRQLLPMMMMKIERCNSVPRVDICRSPFLVPRFISSLVLAISFPLSLLLSLPFPLSPFLSLVLRSLCHLLIIFLISLTSFHCTC